MKSREPGRLARTLHVAKHRVEGTSPQRLRNVGGIAITFGLGWLIGWAFTADPDDFGRAQAWIGIIALTLGVTASAAAFLIEDIRDQDRDLEGDQP